MPDASPTKWHRAHVTWFFEQFLLRPFVPDYRAVRRALRLSVQFLLRLGRAAAGAAAARPDHAAERRRGRRLSRPCRCRGRRADRDRERFRQLIPIIEIGLNHEQQHQELLLTDILHAFLVQRDASGLRSGLAMAARRRGGSAAAGALIAGIHTIGHDGDGFCFDNEQPAHQVLLQPVRLSPSLVTNGEWLEFMADGGYTTPTLWLSDGFAAVEAQGWDAPGYWRKVDGAWFAMTLGGLRRVEPAQPVCHVSYYEADAFARWAGKDLPTEAEWEVAAKSGALDDAFGIVWQWTRSAYSPYPGYRRRARCAWRIQRQVHGQSDGVARLVAGDAGRPFARHLSQFLLSGGPLAIHRLAARGIRTLSRPMTCSHPSRAARGTGHRRPTDPFAADVVAGLTRQAETAAAEIFLRSRPARLCSSASRNCRNIIRRAREIGVLQRQRAGDRFAVSAELRLDRIRQRLKPQGAHSARRRGDASRPMCRSIFPAISCSRTRRSCGAIFRALRCIRWSADFTQDVRRSARGRRAAAGRVFSGLDHRQFRAA